MKFRCEREGRLYLTRPTDFGAAIGAPDLEQKEVENEQADKDIVREGQKAEGAERRRGRARRKNR